MLLSPFTPHVSEEVNEILGNKGSILKRDWPKCLEEHLKEEEVEIAVLTNGKVRDKMVIRVDLPEEEIKEQALQLEKVKKFIKDSPPKKIIYIDKRMVNIVI